MKKRPILDKKNVRFHHRRDYGISIGVGTFNGDTYVALAACKRPGKLQPIAYKDEETGSMHTLPWDQERGDQYNKEDARNSILGKLNSLIKGELRSQAICLGKLEGDSLDAIKAAVIELDLCIRDAILDGHISRKTFADTAFECVASVLLTKGEHATI